MKSAWNPLELLFPYQRRFVSDASRFKIISCSRQCGKSTMFAFESAQDCVARPGASWVVLSSGLRQVKEWMLKAQTWAEIWARAMTDCGYPVSFTAKSECVEFSNGSRIIGVPANHKTARGYSANLILDEFAYHDQPDKIWAGIFPAVSNELAFRYKVRIGSTVAGKNNKFWQLLDDPDSGYSKHVVTIHDAVRDGMPLDVEALRRAVNDDDIWRQEYLCEPVDAASVLLPYDLLERCTSGEASADFFDESELRDPTRKFALGMDIGRQHDLSVLWLVEIVGRRKITRRVETLRRVSLDEQQRRLFELLRNESILCACIDGTGIGYQIAENAEREFGARAVRYMFTAQSKSDLFLGLQREMQRVEFLIPAGAEIREDLHGVQRLFTTGGRVLFSAPTRADGHSDRCSAAALACMAAGKSEGLSACAESVSLFDGRESVPSLSKMSFILNNDGHERKTIPQL